MCDKQRASRDDIRGALSIAKPLPYPSSGDHCGVGFSFDDCDQLRKFISDANLALSLLTDRVVHRRPLEYIKRNITDHKDKIKAAYSKPFCLLPYGK